MDRKPRSRGPRSPRGFKEAEEKYRHLLEDINDGYLLIQEGEAVFANRRCAEIFGYQLEEIVGQPYGRFVVREVVKIAMEAQGRVRASGQVLPERYETMVLNKGGIQVPVEVSIKRIEYEGRPAFSAIVRDITERKRAEAALRQSEHKYRTAIDTARDGFLILDLDYSIVDSNRTNTMALGYTSSEELIGRSALEFVPSDTRGKTREGLEQALSKGYIANLEVVALSRDGREIPVEVNISLLTGEEGQPAGFVLVIRDIRRRKQAEEEIRRRSRELSALNAVAATVSQTLDLDELLNDALEKVLEVVDMEAGSIRLVEGEELTLQAHRGLSPQFVHGVERVRIGEGLTGEVAQSGKPIVLENISEDPRLSRSVVRDEGMRAFASVPLKSKDKVVGVLNVMSHAQRQISSREIALLEAIGNQIAVGIENARLFEQTAARAEELRAFEERLRALIENAPYAIYVHDLEAKFIDGNKKAEEMTGYSREELIGKSFLEVGLLPEEYLPKAIEALEKNVRGEPVGPDEFELIRKDGSRVSVEIRSIPVERGGKVEIMGIASDITERKRAEEELKQSEEKYRTLFESVLEAVFVIDAETMRLVLANEAVAKIYGFDSVEDVIGVNPLDFVPPEDRDRVLSIIVKDMFENDLRDVNEFRTITKDGREIWIAALGTRTEYQGRLAGLISIRDITERKRAEEERALLYQEIKDKAERISVTAELTRIIGSSLNISDVYKAFADRVKNIVDFDRVSITLVEGDRLRFLVVSSMVETELGRGATIPLEKSATAWVMENKKVNIERDFARERQFPIDVTFLNEGLRSAIRVPLFSKGEVFGTFNLASRHSNAYGEREQEILEELAPQIAVAIENDRLYEEAKQRQEELETAYHQILETAAALERGKQELEDAYLKMARTLVLTLEARDPYTRGHSERVAQISRQIAFELELSQEEMRQLETAARLHDLGKIGIPDVILLKPSAITPSERAEIQLHPTRAVELLRFLAFLEGTLPIIEHHHEHYNGGGYPNSLRGEQTPLGARILAVADAYDAMTSARPYRPAMTSERAIEILRQGAGTQWDPDVVEAFLRAFGN